MPDKLLVIASNFLSNPSKLFIEKYVQSNKPRFRIKTWERSDLERLAVGQERLEEKYRFTGSDLRFADGVAGLSDPLFLNGIANTIAHSPFDSDYFPFTEIDRFDGAGL